MVTLALVAVVGGIAGSWATWRWQRSEIRRERRREAWVAWASAFVYGCETAHLFGLALAKRPELTDAQISLRSRTQALILVEYDSHLLSGAFLLAANLYECSIELTKVIEAYESEASLIAGIESTMDSVRARFDGFCKALRAQLDDRDAIDRLWAMDTRDRRELND